MQVTYNGIPLYYYSKDTKPGDTTGEGVGGIWHVVKPGSTPTAGGATTAGGTPAATGTAAAAGTPAATGTPSGG